MSEFSSPEAWDNFVFRNAVGFRLHRYHGRGGCDRMETPSFATACAEAKAALAAGYRVLMYAVTVSGRSACVTQEKWG